MFTKRRDARPVRPFFICLYNNGLCVSCERIIPGRTNRASLHHHSQSCIVHRASCIDNCASLQSSLVAVAVVGGWADDDVVLHGDVDDFAGFHDAAGEVVVLR